MQRPLVSIVIPVYNTENYITRCVESILQQTYNNIEIILVDDGSTDSSLKVLMNYKEKYPSKINVIPQNNSGSGLARKTGVENSKGQYITFVDSDDELKPTAIEDLLASIKNSTDVVISGFCTKQAKANKTKLHVPKNNSLWIQLKYSCTAFKLYNKNFLTKHLNYFTNTLVLEDVALNAVLFSKTNNIIIQNKCNYINHLRTDSTTQISKNNIIDITPTLKFIENNINKSKYSRKIIYYFYLKTIVQNILMQNTYHSKIKMCKLYSNYYEWLKQNYKLHFFWQKDEEFLINAIINMFVFFTKIRMQKVLLNILRKLKIKA